MGLPSQVVLPLWISRLRFCDGPMGSGAQRVPLCASPHGALDVGVVEEQRTDPKRVRDCIHLQTASRWANVLPRISACLRSARRSPGAAD
jgi:hypothetical protein